MLVKTNCLCVGSRPQTEGDDGHFFDVGYALVGAKRAAVDGYGFGIADLVEEE